MLQMLTAVHLFSEFLLVRSKRLLRLTKRGVTLVYAYVVAALTEFQTERWCRWVEGRLGLDYPRAASGPVLLPARAVASIAGIYPSSRGV
jgi:hypothetical protein